MKQSKLFVKTRREAPKDEVSKNAQLLIRAGYVHKEMAGVYSYLPLGRRVLQKVEQIIREEMDAIGGQEIRMATLHPSEPWKQTGAWDGVDVLFKINSRTEKEYALGQSEEEIVTPIAQQYVTSYKDLPVAIYQIGQKYRDELRAKSGIMRGREFGMKDMYSFHATQEDFDRFYAVVKGAYLNVYKRMGLVAKVTEASGGSFSEKISYEFEVLTDAGEDVIFYCENCDFCVEDEIAKIKPGEACPRCSVGVLKEAKSVEVGNVFDLGQKYPKAFNFTYKAEDGTDHHPIVGCFGIGTTRLMGTIVEVFADEKGIVWPESVAPFRVHLIEIANDNDDVKKEAAELYRELNEAGVEVLWDDRDARAGEKFADSELMGIPLRVVVSEKTLAAGKFECVHRASGKTEHKSITELIGHLTA
ncbi:MAG: aminoacyl--tRNA ligase-related protein [Candidatus Adlerbacteria bacterium]